MKERWKNIKGYEGLYQISTLGIVKSLTRKVKQLSRSGIPTTNVYPSKVLKQEKTNRGYYRITLSKNNKTKRYSLHRLMLETFKPNDDKTLHVNHKDGDKSNNCLSNLEWCTQSENQKHAYRTGLQLPVKDEQHGQCKLTNQEVLEIRYLYRHTSLSQQSIADIFNISRQHVGELVNFKSRNTH